MDGRDYVWSDTSVDDTLCAWYIQDSTGDESTRWLQLQE